MTADVFNIGDVRRKARKPRPAKYVWLDYIKAHTKLGDYPHLSRRLIVDLAELLSLFSSFSAEGVYAGRANLGRRLGVSPRQVSRGLAALADMGYLKVTRRGPTTNLMTPTINGKRLFPIAGEVLSGPAVQSKVHTDLNGWATQSPEMSGPEGPPSLLKLESNLQKQRPPQTPQPADPSADHTAEPSGETASGLPRKEDQIGVALVGDVITPDQIAFQDFWAASGMVGKIGPAMGTWNKLSKSDRRAIADIILRDGVIETGGVWAYTWLVNRCWEQPVPRWEQPVPPKVSIGNSFSETFAGGRDHPLMLMLAPYSDEWQAEHARRVARGQPVHLMEDWARRGNGWPVV
jgi:DNA-binding transcriptional ArsR family regulator